MSYAILRTDKFNDQLHDILQYIAEDSGSVDAALGVLDRLEAAIRKLAEAPRMGSLPRYAILRRQGYRALIVERHLVFYKVDDTRREVVACAIVDSRREYLYLV